MELLRFARFMYQPIVPMGKDGRLITGSNAHWALAKKACNESTVLLKNDGTLPLQNGERICLFGTGAGDFQFGGGGSGKVYAERLISLSDALLNLDEKGEISYFTPMRDFYLDEVEKIYSDAKLRYPTEREFAAWQRKFKMPLFDLPEELYKKAKEFGGTAIFCLSRYSSEGDSDGDRPGGKGDFELWDNEKALLDRICKDFEKVVVILNTCGPVSTEEYKRCDKIGAVLYPLYGGGMAGDSLGDILMGKAYPSGHLQDTLAQKMEDYPGSETFHESPYYVNYTEDIFVGYRYFETFAPEKVSFPFGFGLGYTTFEIKPLECKYKGFRVNLKVQVSNTGKFPGKEVAQVYLSAPQGKLGKAAKVLCAFQKTKEILPGEKQTLSLSFNLKDFASFDDLGKIKKCAFVLEEGEYTVLLGNNVRDTTPCLKFALPKDVICQLCHEYMAPRALKERLTASGKTEKLPRAKKSNFKPKVTGLLAKKPEELFTLAKALEEDRLEEFLATLTDEELGEMLYGHEMMNASSTNAIGLMPRYYLDDKKLIPMIPTADGPMGIRARPGRGILATHFPGENAVSQSWNLDLAKKIGKTIAMEAKECNLGIWLAPAMNIHRHPRCGRNFEYFSEDPLTTGLFAASYVTGVQSQKIAATIKHFCCNNREYNRREADSRLSMRALREIYLKGFEIAIKKANPWALMTSYNPINGEQGSTNAEGIGGILREEWGYEGVVMTDWRTYSLLEDEVKAGGDVKMPQVVSTVYAKAPKTADPGKMIQKGIIPRDMAIDSARRIFKLMSHLD